LGQLNEYLLSLDEFSKPKVVEGNDAVFVLLVRLLLLEPGTVDLTHPLMGIGLISRYRYSYEENLSDLQGECASQIATYLPDLIGVDVKLSMDQNKELLVNITVDGTLYLFRTDSINNTIVPLSSILT